MHALHPLVSPRRLFALSLFALVLLVLSACSTQSGDPQPGSESKNPPTEPISPPIDVALEVAEQETSVIREDVRQHAAEVAGRTRLADTALPMAQIAKSGHYNSRPPAPFYQDQGREAYENFDNNGIFWAKRDPVSTFSVDVDSAAYANMRRQLNHGQIPNPDSIRVEELVNYFSYDYPRAQDRDTPFSIYTEMGPSPWHPERQLVHIGINGWQPDMDKNLPSANLVFLIDVSGSMQAPNKIPLLKSAMRMLVKQLRPQDRVAIAVYAGAAGEVLAPTPGNEKATINAAIENLRAGGSTNGGAGIKLAYSLARQHFEEGGINRVILATDGDFNVGTTDITALERLVEKERKSGVALTVLGFGTGNYNDHLMQKIAQIGNGNAAYIDTINEARKVLVEELSATLNIIAKDMKVQVEFNPAVVETYRLVGYETRHLNREDFNNDKVDAGEVGAGHTVTALYEITLKGSSDSIADPLRYATTDPTVDRNTGELAFVKLRYKRPAEETSRLITMPLKVADLESKLSATSESFRFAGAVAWMGQLLRNHDAVQNADIAEIIQLANGAKGSDEFGYRSEFINLARTLSAMDLESIAAVDVEPRH